MVGDTEVGGGHRSARALSGRLQFTVLRRTFNENSLCMGWQVTRKSPEDIVALARDGAYIHGLFLEGAR